MNYLNETPAVLLPGVLALQAAPNPPESLQAHRRDSLAFGLLIADEHYTLEGQRVRLINIHTFGNDFRAWYMA